MGESRTVRQAPLVLAIAGACTLALAWRHLPWPQLPWEPLLGAAVLFAAAAAATLVARRLARRWWPSRREGATASRIELSGRQAVVEAGNRMLKSCRRDKEPLSVAVVELSDLPEVQALFGSEVAGQITRRMAVRLQAIATDRGLAERTSATEFTVLLPGMEAATAYRALQASFGEGGCVEYEGDGDELVLLPQFRVAEVPQHHASIVVTYSSVCSGVARASGPAGPAQAYLPTVPVPL